MSASGSTSFWQSVLNSKKAIFAAFATTVAWIGGVLAANGGRNLTTTEWIIAAGAFLVAHAGTYAFTNEKPPRAQLVEGGASVTPAPAPVVVQVTTPAAQVVAPTALDTQAVSVADDPAVVAAQAQLDASLAAINTAMDQLVNQPASVPVDLIPAEAVPVGTPVLVDSGRI